MLAVLPENIIAMPMSRVMHLFGVLVNTEYGMGAGDESVAVLSSYSVEGMDSAMLLTFWIRPR